MAKTVALLLLLAVAVSTIEAAGRVHVHPNTIQPRADFGPAFQGNRPNPFHFSRVPQRPVPKSKFDREDSFDRASRTIVGCNRTVDLVPGEYVMSSPGWPGDYPNYVDCARTFNVPKDIAIKISCPKFSLYSGRRADNSCWGDRVDMTVDGEVTQFCKKELDNDGEVADIDGKDEAWSFSFDFINGRYVTESGFNCAIEVIDQNAPPPDLGNIEPENPTAACDCGRKGKPESSRIVGGSPTTENEWPWQVALVRRGTTRPFCGGSIINNRYILTAAHCTNELDSPQDMEIIVGEHDHTDNGDGQVRMTVNDTLEHPQYNSGTVDYDYALVRLDDLLTFNDQVRPVCLPPDNQDPFESDQAVVTGWGTIASQGSQPDKLKEAVLETMPNSVCRNRYGGSITGRMICATGPNESYNRDSCQGDSGGPLVIKNEKNRFELAGIVSWGRGCASPGYPGVYARTSTVLNWIKSNTNHATECKNNPL